MRAIPLLVAMMVACGGTDSAAPGGQAGGGTSAKPAPKLPDMSGTWTVQGLLEVDRPALYAASTIQRSSAGSNSWTYKRQVEVKTQDRIRTVGKGQLEGTIKVVNGQVCNEVSSGSFTAEDWASSLPLKGQLEELFSGGFGKLGCADVADAKPGEVTFKRGMVTWTEKKQG